MISHFWNAVAYTKVHPFLVSLSLNSHKWILYIYIENNLKSETFCDRAIVIAINSLMPNRGRNEEHISIGYWFQEQVGTKKYHLFYIWAVSVILSLRSSTYTLTRTSVNKNYETENSMDGDIILQCTLLTHSDIGNIISM